MTPASALQCWRDRLPEDQLRSREVTEFLSRVWDVGGSLTCQEAGDSLILALLPFTKPEPRILRGLLQHAVLLTGREVTLQPDPSPDAPREFAALTVSPPAISVTLHGCLETPGRGARFLDTALLRDTGTKLLRALELLPLPPPTEEVKKRITDLVANVIQPLAKARGAVHWEGNRCLIEVDTCLSLLSEEGFPQALALLSQVAQENREVRIELSLSQSERALEGALERALGGAFGPRQLIVDEKQRLAALLLSRGTPLAGEYAKRFKAETGLALHPIYRSHLSQIEKEAEEWGATTVLPATEKVSGGGLSESYAALTRYAADHPLRPDTLAENDHLYLFIPLDPIPPHYLERMAETLRALPSLAHPVTIISSEPEQGEELTPHRVIDLVRELVGITPPGESVQVREDVGTIIFRELEDSQASRRELEILESVQAIQSLAPRLRFQIERAIDERFVYDVIAKACIDNGLKMSWAYDPGGLRERKIPVSCGGSDDDRQALRVALARITKAVSFDVQASQPGETSLLIEPAWGYARAIPNLTEAEHLAKMMLGSLPRSLGFKRCDIQGNTFELQTELRQLPRHAMPRLVEQLKEYGVRVRVACGTRSVLDVPSREELTEFIAISAPNSVVIRGIRDDKNGLLIRLNSPHDIQQLITDWRIELSSLLGVRITTQFDRAAGPAIAQSLRLFEDANSEIARWEGLERVHATHFPIPPPFEASQECGPTRSIRVIAIDPAGTRIRESGLSAERLQDGTIRLGHHVVNRNAIIPVGSPAEAHALRYPVGLYGERSVRLPFHVPSVEARGSLMRGRRVPVISTYCQVDAGTGEYGMPEICLENIRVHAAPDFSDVNNRIARIGEVDSASILQMLVQAKDALVRRRLAEGAFVELKENQAEELVDFFSVFFDGQSTKWVQTHAPTTPLIYRAAPFPDAAARRAILQEVQALTHGEVSEGAIDDPGAFSEMLQASMRRARPGQIDRIVARYTGRGRFSEEREENGGLVNTHARITAPWRKIDAFLNQANLVAALSGTPPPFDKAALRGFAATLSDVAGSKQIQRRTSEMNFLDAIIAHGQRREDTLQAIVVTPSQSQAASQPLIFIPSLAATGVLSSKPPGLRALSPIPVRLSSYRTSLRMGIFDLVS